MEETERCLARLTELDPGNFNYWVSRAALEYNRGRPSYGNQYLRAAAELDMARVRHLLLREGFIDELREQGNTNLLHELEAIIGPTEGDDMEQYDIE
jgi:hypothetical protein